MKITEKILFNRYAKLEFKPKNEDSHKKSIVLLSTDIDFDASVTLDMSYNANKAHINIYNLPKSFEDQIENGTMVFISAGYDNGEDPEYGLLFTGIVERLETSKQNMNIITEIQCSDVNDIYKDMLFQVTLKSNKKDTVKISTIIKKIMEKAKAESKKYKEKTELTLIEPITLGRDYGYERSKSFNGNLKNILTRLAKDSDSFFSFEQNSLKFFPYSNPNLPEIVYSPTRILNITKSDLGYTLTTLFDHRMKAAHKLKIKINQNRYTDALNSAPNQETLDAPNFDYPKPSSSLSEVDIYIITKVDHSINPKSGAHTTTIEIESQNKVKAQRLADEASDKEEKEREKKVIKIEI